MDRFNSRWDTKWKGKSCKESWVRRKYSDLSMERQIGEHLRKEYRKHLRTKNSITYVIRVPKGEGRENGTDIMF